LQAREPAREGARYGARRTYADIAQLSVQLDSADDDLRDRADGGSVCEGALETGGDPAGAAAEESRGVRMAIDRAAIIEAKAFGDRGGACPSEEFAFDRIALRVAANDALAGVTGRRAAG